MVDIALKLERPASEYEAAIDAALSEEAYAEIDERDRRLLRELWAALRKGSL